MSYDPDFDDLRLKQLASQYLGDNCAEGRVIFFSESPDNRLDYATWQFDREANKALKESAFRWMLMELLDILLIYRFQHDQPNASQGIVSVQGSEIDIAWVPTEVAKAEREAGFRLGES